MTPSTKRTLRFALIGLAVVFLAGEIYAQAAPAGWLDRGGRGSIRRDG